MNSTELHRLIENLVGIGTIAEVSADHSRARVAVADRPPGNWLPVPGEITNRARGWQPLRLGTQVVVLCPGGDPAQAVIGAILYSDALPPPETGPDVTVTRWEDGTTVRYDAAAQAMTVTTPGSVTVEAAASLTASTAGPVAVTAAGAVTVTSAASVVLTAPSVLLNATQPGAGAAEMVGSFRLRGDLEVIGEVTVTGNQHVSGNLTCDGVNSNHHSH